MILAMALVVAFGAADPAAGQSTKVRLVNNTGNQALGIRVDGRDGCNAAAKGGDCAFDAPVGFHHFTVFTKSGQTMEKSLYVSSDNDFVWTVEGKDLPGASRWQTADNHEKLICKMQLTVSGIARKVCASKASWEADNTRTRQDMMVKQRGFCGGGASC
jgi:hypothetical protein